jgi:hypothetical protein
MLPRIQVYPFWILTCGKSTVKKQDFGKTDIIAPRNALRVNCHKARKSSRVIALLLHLDF